MLRSHVSVPEISTARSDANPWHLWFASILMAMMLQVVSQSSTYALVCSQIEAIELDVCIGGMGSYAAFIAGMGRSESVLSVASPRPRIHSIELRWHFASMSLKATASVPRKWSP